MISARDELEHVVSTLDDAECTTALELVRPLDSRGEIVPPLDRERLEDVVKGYTDDECERALVLLEPLRHPPDDDEPDMPTVTPAPTQ